MAVELLLLSGGAAAAGLPVVLLLARAGRRIAWPRGALPSLSEDLGQPRLARARGSALPQRHPGRGRGARLRRRRPADARGVPDRALFRDVRLQAAGALRTPFGGYPGDTNRAR